MSAQPIKPKDRDTLIQALRAGVVPRAGLRHVQVGRAREVQEIIKDVARVKEGGSTVRFIIGEYGSGKTFFLNLARAIALEQKLVVVHADLSPDRRLHASGGQARGLYAELLRNASTRTRPEGGALSNIVEKFISDSMQEAAFDGKSVSETILAKVAPLQDLVGGYDFANVLVRYHRGFEEGNDTLKAAALRWMRGEYAIKTEAREALGVRSIIDDANVYDHLKLIGAFVVIAGYDGLFIVLDEMVNLYKLVNSVSRNANYEQLLRMLNDVLQGDVHHLGIIFGGTPEFLMDTRRGLYSYEALRSRLAENQFAHVEGLVDLSGPIIRLQSLTPEELYVLLINLRNIFAGGDETKWLVPDEALTAFMQHCAQRVGEAYFRTPRNTIKAFLDLLAVLEQNPGTDWRKILSGVELAPDQAPAGADIDDSSGNAPTGDPQSVAAAAPNDVDGFASFRI
jgi:hypothetical protein